MAEGLCLNGRKRLGEAAEGPRAQKRRKADGGGPGLGPEEKSCRLSAALLGEGSEISQEQLYELLKYAALGKCHNAAQPSWCHVYHQRHLAGVVVVVLHEMSQLHFYRFYLQFKHLRKVFRHVSPQTASVSSKLLPVLKPHPRDNGCSGMTAFSKDAAILDSYSK